MDKTGIAVLLEPFLDAAEDRRLTADDLKSISTYIDLLLRWNARINLTAIRDPEQIVTRHFGESFFAARHLFPNRKPEAGSRKPSVADVGAGAGFPGIPIKLWAPQISLTLIEPNYKKATFLREVVRALTLTDINIRAARAEHLLNDDLPINRSPNRARLQQQSKRPVLQQNVALYDLVTLRAVEKFANILPTAAALTAPHGRLALLIGSSQKPHAISSIPGFHWLLPIPVPLSKERIVLIGTNEPE